MIDSYLQQPWGLQRRKLCERLTPSSMVRRHTSNIHSICLRYPFFRGPTNKQTKTPDLFTMTSVGQTIFTQNDFLIDSTMLLRLVVWLLACLLPAVESISVEAARAFAGFRNWTAFWWVKRHSMIWTEQSTHSTFEKYFPWNRNLVFRLKERREPWSSGYG